MSTNELVESHYQKHWGKHTNSFVDLSPAWHVDLLVFPPTQERPIYTIATRGLSNFEQLTPAGREAYRRMELIIYLPGDWEVKLDGESKGLPSTWACALLKFGARYMIDKKTYMGPGSVSHTEDYRHSAFSRFPFAIFVPPLGESPDFYPLQSGGYSIEFCALMLITQAEADFMKNNGFIQLMKAMESKDTLELIMHPLRKCTFEAEDKGQYTRAEVDRAIAEIEREDAEAKVSTAKNNLQVPRPPAAVNPIADRQTTSGIPLKNFTVMRPEDHRSNEEKQSTIPLGCIITFVLWIAALFLIGSNWWDANAPKGAGWGVFLAGPLAGAVCLYLGNKSKSD